MAMISDFVLALLCTQHVAAVMVGGGRTASGTPVGADERQWFFNLGMTWADINRLENIPPAPDINFSDPNQLCFASPTIDVVKSSGRQIKENIIQGRQRAQSMKVIFAGLIRNAGLSVNASYEMLKGIGSHFKDFHFLLFENDSKDDTVKRMIRIAEDDPRYEFQSESLSMGDEDSLERSRMKRMAIVRNKLHDWIKTFVHKSAIDWDLVVMYDFDQNVAQSHVVTPHAFMAALGRQESLKNEWDVLCADRLYRFRPNQEASFHDCFAFRDSHNDSFNHYCEKGSSVLFLQYDLVPAHSCFGGLAMYKPQKFLGCRYDPSLYDCEHVGFHKCMRASGSEGRIFIDPLLTVVHDPWTQPTCIRV